MNKATKFLMRKFIIDKDATRKRDMLESEEVGREAMDAAKVQQVLAVVDQVPGAITGRPIVTSDELFVDLEVHEPLHAASGSGSDNSNSRRTLLAALDATALTGGRKLLAALLSRPTDDTALLRARQASLQRVAAAADATDAPRVLQAMRALEPDVLWMLRYRSDESLRTLYDIAFFRTWFMRGLNSSSWALTATNAYRMFVSPMVGILSPVVYFVVPFLVIRFKMGVKLTLGQYVWFMYKSMMAADSLVKMPASMQWAKYVSYAFSLLFYFQSVFTSLEMSSVLRKVCGTLSSRVGRVSEFFDLADGLRGALWADDVEGCWFPHFSASPSSSSQEQQCPLGGGGGGGGSGVFQGAEGGIPGTGGSLLSCNFGARLKAFRAFDDVRAVELLREAYALDALVSVTCLRRAQGMVWADFLDGEKQQGGPVMELEGLRHPCLPPHLAVENTWKLGARDGSSRHVLLTGPNAGGKSTLLKGVLTAALMAQTLTIAPCTVSMRITPFGYISSHINVPDNQGRESLFEAEMRRSKRNLEVLKGLPNRRALLVMDEIFSSTNPLEGIAGAFAVAKSMASHPGALCVISTHYLYLCKLEKDTGGAFRNFRMPVTLDEKGDGGVLSYPYRVERGISRQYVALELLRKSGFGDAILDEALAIKKALLSPPPPPPPPPPAPAVAPPAVAPPVQAQEQEQEQEQDAQEEAQVIL